MAEKTIQWDKDADGIVTLTMDDPTGSANVMNEHYTESMRNAVDRLVAEKDSITGVVITSAKKTFFAGGDLKDMTADRPKDATKADWAATWRNWCRNAKPPAPLGVAQRPDRIDRQLLTAGLMTGAIRPSEPTTTITTLETFDVAPRVIAA